MFEERGHACPPCCEVYLFNRRTASYRLTNITVDREHFKQSDATIKAVITAIAAYRLPVRKFTWPDGLRQFCFHLTLFSTMNAQAAYQPLRYHQRQGG
ncbi:hypothetical protein D3C76_1268410 [compost metagenome]